MHQHKKIKTITGALWSEERGVEGGSSTRRREGSTYTLESSYVGYHGTNIGTFM
jgi:hypothetical protein